MTFRVYVECDNAAFKKGKLPEELSRILNEISQKVKDWDIDGIILDIDRNIVGHFNLQ